MKISINQALRSGIFAHKKGKFDEAEYFYQTILQIQPNHPDANHNLGILKVSINKSKLSLPFFKKATEVNKHNEQFWISYINTLIKERQFDNVKESCKKALAINSNFIIIYNIFANFEKELGRFKEAEIIYKKAIKIKPKFAVTHFNFANLLKKLGRLEEAEASYKKAIKIKPELVDAHFNLSNTLLELNKLTEAEIHYKKTIKLKPDHIKAHCNLASTLNELGRLEEAESNFSKALHINPDYKIALLGRGQILFDKKEFELSLRDFDSCNTPDSRARALTSLYALKKIDDIYSRINKSAELDDQNLRVAAFSTFITDKEKKDTTHKFCKKPMDFIHFSNISSHLKNSEFFIEEVIEELNHINARWEPLGRTTHKGFHSGNKVSIFKSGQKKINKLQSIIIDELDLYKKKFKNETCSYIKKWPTKKYNLFAWYVILKSQGYQSAHIHPSGWLSGVIYLKVVPPLKKNEGSIEFDLSGQNYFNINSLKLNYQPKVGDIVLFPSSLHHRTIPFTTDTDRIIISFDLIPGQ
tara:strand:- start:4064 stop:5647 length:1584 start_codon:yes stop_codon:yes gene_type:complete